MAATSFDPRNPTLVSHYGVPQIVSTELEADSQTFLAGELVYFNSGAVTVATASSVIGGVALAGGTDESSASVTNATIAVQIMSPDDEILIRCASDASGTLALANTFQSGTDYAIDATSNLWYADSSDTSAGNLTFVGPIFDAAGDSTYWGRFKASYNKLGSTQTA